MQYEPVTILMTHTGISFVINMESTLWMKPTSNRMAWVIIPTELWVISLNGKRHISTESAEWLNVTKTTHP